jgi:hypothetical protein
MSSQDTQSIEVIATFDEGQEFLYIKVPIINGYLSEPAVMAAAFAEIPAEQLPSLCKLSLQLFNIPSEAAAKELAPWIFCKDSPLHQGKLWLKQHAVQPAAA